MIFIYCDQGDTNKVSVEKEQSEKEVLELMIPPQTGWVAQWQSILHVMG